jgi:hypothetical protein
MIQFSCEGGLLLSVGQDWPTPLALNGWGTDLTVRRGNGERSIGVHRKLPGVQVKKNSTSWDVIAANS